MPHRTISDPAFPYLPSFGAQMGRGVHLAAWKHAGRDVLLPMMSNKELVTGTPVTVPEHMTTADCAEWLYRLLDDIDPVCETRPARASLAVVPLAVVRVLSVITTFAAFA